MPTFKAHFISDDNLVFPDVLDINEENVIIYKGKLFGDKRTVINRRNISGVRLINGLLFSTIIIETTGGMRISANGFVKKDGKEILSLLT